MCSRQILGLSDLLYKKANRMGGIDDPIQFKYTDYSFAAVKFFIDSMYRVEPGPTDVTLILEVRMKLIFSEFSV